MGVLVKERVKGEWWIYISHHGKRKAKKIGRDENLAREVAKRIEAKLALGEFDIEEEKKESPTFKEYAEKWLSSYIKNLRRESTFERYSSLLRNHIFPVIGKMEINKIKRGDIRDLLLAIHNKGLSKGTVSLAHDVIGGPLSYALDAELIPNNPSRGILKHLNIQRDEREFIDSFNHGEVNLFLENCYNHFPEYYPFFLCAFRTGMRLGELLGLQWADVDWNGKFILVRRSYNNSGKISPTKTGKSRRVDISDQLFETLRGLYTLRKKEGLKMGLGEAVECIFHRSGKPTEQYYIRRVFNRCLRKAGLREIRVHDIRHSYASLLLSDGVSPVYVKEQLGHSSIRVTVDVYGHLIPNSNRGVVNRLDTQLAATQAQPKTVW